MTWLITLALIVYSVYVYVCGKQLSSLHSVAQDQDELNEQIQQIRHEREVEHREFDLDIDHLLNKYTHLHR